MYNGYGPSYQNYGINNQQRQPIQADQYEGADAGASFPTMPIPVGGCPVPRGYRCRWVLICERRYPGTVSGPIGGGGIYQ